MARVGESGEPRRERWQLLQNLAIVARRSGDFGAARALLERAEEEGKRANDAAADVVIGNGWGQLLLAAGDARGAELHLREAHARATGPRERVAIGVNLGESLLAQRRALEAGEAAREAEANAIAGGVTGKLPEVYRLLAAVARERGESEAFVFLEEALELIREEGLPPFEEALTRRAYGELRLAEGDPERGRLELAESARLFESLGMENEAGEIFTQLAREEDAS
jgi:tetratricopeptide (TPR) repeat protein